MIDVLKSCVLNTGKIVLGLAVLTAALILLGTGVMLATRFVGGLAG